VEGWRLLAERGICAEEKSYTPADIHSIAYVEHDLQINALVLDIAHRARAGDGPLLDAMPFGWHGPRRGESDPRQEQQPQGGCEWRSSLPPVFYEAESREGVLKPDTTLIVGGTEPCQAVLIEFDPTARPHKQLDRLRRYDWFLADGWMDGRFDHARGGARHVAREYADRAGACGASSWTRWATPTPGSRCASTASRCAAAKTRRPSSGRSSRGPRYSRQSEPSTANRHNREP
jgi:hypothetical protein